MQIKEAIIHQLIKVTETKGDGCVKTQLRPLRLNIDDFLNATVQTLIEAYAKSLSGYGSLGQDPNLHRFPVLMHAYLNRLVDDEQAFLNFASNSLNLIAAEMQQEFFATSGYALFIRYSNLGEDWLLVVMLKLKPGAGVDPVSMDFQKTLTLDLSKLHEAARVNLTRWKVNEQPYLSFVKPKGSKVSDYFRQALSCIYFTDSKHNTTQVINALGAFIQSRDDILDGDKIERLIQARKCLYECFVQSPNEVVLATISAAVMPGDPIAFNDFIREGQNAADYQINDTFRPDKATYSRIKRMREKMGSVTVSFDVEDIQEGRVRYDRNLRSLVLANPTQKLIDEIDKYDPPAPAPIKA